LHWLLVIIHLGGMIKIEQIKQIADSGVFSGRYGLLCKVTAVDKPLVDLVSNGRPLPCHATTQEAFY
jgi:hypothetical protein